MSGTQKLNPTLDVLLKLRERLSDPTRWCQNNLQDAAGANCLLGALYRIDGTGFDGRGLKSGACHDAFLKIDVAAFERGEHGLVQFNNTHTHAEVLAFIDAVIAKTAEQP